MVANLVLLFLAFLVLGPGALAGYAGQSDEQAGPNPTPLATARSLRAAPYPPSRLVESIDWHWETYQTSAPGSDL